MNKKDTSQDLNTQAATFQKTAIMLVKKFKADFEHELAQCDCGLSALQYVVLKEIHAQSMTVHDLADKFLIKSPSLIPVVDFLEKKGLIKRHQDKVDRRKIQLDITAKGKNFYKKMPVVDSLINLRKALDTIGKEKTSTLIMLLQELTQHLN